MSRTIIQWLFSLTIAGLTFLQYYNTARPSTDQDQDSGTLRRRLLTFKPAAGRAKIRTFNRNITSEKYLLLHHFTTAIKPLSGVGELVQNRHKYEIISGYFLTILCSIRISANIKILTIKISFDNVTSFKWARVLSLKSQIWNPCAKLRTCSKHAPLLCPVRNMCPRSCWESQLLLEMLSASHGEYELSVETVRHPGWRTAVCWCGGGQCSPNLYLPWHFSSILHGSLLELLRSNQGLAAGSYV